MGDVGIIKKLDDIPELKEKLIEEFDKKCYDHKLISKYSLLLGQHILNLSNVERIKEIDDCFSINILWQEGKVRFQAARDVADIVLKLAKDEKDQIKNKVFRVMAQVANTPHVKRHALIASDYAIKLVNIMYPGNFEEVRKERQIQIELMKSV